MNITYSSELMRNYKQSNVISPQKKFKAVQTDSGDALLFSIGTDGTLYLIEQSSGSNATGWEEIPLSSQLASKNLSHVVAKDFAVAQNLSNGDIDLALVMTVNSKDTLYVSLRHANKKGSITSDIVWSAMTYDDPRHAGISLDIEDVFISKSSGGEYIVADISESSFTPPRDFLKRYYIDPQRTTGTFWNPMVIGGDLEPGIQTRIGRKSSERVDGTYTLGRIGGVVELLYAPLYNPFDRNAPPVITRLNMPAGASALAVADTGNGTTDLFVAAGNELYYFAAGKQQDNATGQKVFSHKLLQDVVELHAYKSSTQYVVWGLNRADQVFYTSCEIADVLNSSKWSLPLPIITGVDKISPYANRADNANIIFSAGTNEVNISVQSPQTTIWNTQTIHLTAPPQSNAHSFSSYTTRVQLNDGENNPLPDKAVLISASSPVPVYINHLYFLLNRTPISVTSDKLGSFTIVKPVSGLDSVQLTIAEEGGTSVMIDPMEKPFNKSVSLDSKEKLKSAVITSPDGTTKPLVSGNISDSDLESVAQANKNLASAYSSVTTIGNQPSPMALATTPVLKSISGSLIEGIETDVGNLLSWLESGIKHTVEIIENEATGLWHFIVKVGGEIYHGVLDCVEKLVGAVRWVFHAIEVAIEDLLKFLEFLFEWNDITRTKEVLKNLVKRYLQHEVDQIEVVKERLNEEIKQLVQTINGWAGIDDWSGLGEAATQPANASSTPNKNSSAPGDMMSYHMNNNAGNITQNNPPPALHPNQSPIDTLLNALKQEGKVLDAVFEQLKELSSDYSNLDLSTILKRLIAIIADGVLESAEVVMDAMLDIIYELVSAVLDVLDTEIYIPVISDILKDFGVPSISFLDLFCWITAVPVTIGYKIDEGKAPFPDDASTTFLKTATTWESIEQVFTSSNTSLKQSGAVMLEAIAVNDTAEVSVDSNSNSDRISLSESTKKAIFVSGHAASGFLTINSCFVSTFEAEAETGKNPFSIPSAVLGVLSAGTKGIAALLVPKEPLKNTTMQWVNRITTGSVILSKLIFSGPAQKKFGAASGTMKILKVADGRATGAIVNSILVIPAVACTLWHFYELSQDSPSSTRSAAIIDELSNVTSYISRISYAVAVNVPEPDTKQISIGIMVVANIATGGLQTADAIVGA